MEEKFTLEFTKEELLAIREALTAYYGPEWVNIFLRSVFEKVYKAYKKPQISPEEYKRRMDEAEERYKNDLNKGYMLSEEKRKIKFYYELPEEVPG